MTAKKDNDEFSGGRLCGVRLLDEFRLLLREELLARAPHEISKSETDPRRLLFAEQYFSALLLAYYNPVLQSARAVVGASKTSETVRRAIGADAPRLVFRCAASL